MRLAALIRDLENADHRRVRGAIESMKKVDASGRQATVLAILKLAGKEQDQALRELAKDAVKTLFAPTAYTRAEIEQIQKLSECRATGTDIREREADGQALLKTRVAGNGCVFLKFESEKVRWDVK